MLGDLPHILTINQHLPVLRVVEPTDEIHQRGLTGTALADNSDELARLNLNADVFQDGSVRVITKGHIPEFNRAMHIVQFHSLRIIGNAKIGVEHLKHPLAGRHETRQPV